MKKDSWRVIVRSTHEHATGDAGIDRGPERQFVRFIGRCDHAELVNNQRTLMWRFRSPAATDSRGPAEHISCRYLMPQALRSEPCRVEGTRNVPKNGEKWQFFQRISSIRTLVYTAV